MKLIAAIATGVLAMTSTADIWGVAANETVD